MSRINSSVAAMFLFISLGIAHAGGPAAKIEGPARVPDDIALVKVKAPKTKETVFVGVIPARTPQALWIQNGSKLEELESELFVQLGDGAIGKGDRFQVVIVTAPEGAIKGLGKIDLGQQNRLKIRIVARHTIDRD